MSKALDDVMLSDVDVMMLYDAWDRMDSAAQKVTTSLPFQLTEAVAALDHERLAMRSAIKSILRNATKAVTP